MTDIQKQRFWSKVDKSSGCWIWKAATYKGYKAHYGHFWSNGKNVPAHRFSYEMCRGQIPDGMTINHDCRTTLCVRPSHLSVMTLRDNIRCGGYSIRTHCKRGHAFIPENLEKCDNGYRRCILCRRIRTRKNNRPIPKHSEEQRRKWAEASRRYKAKKKIESYIKQMEAKG
jgi:hypothetical protein